MTDHSSQIEQIKAARSLDELRVIVNKFPATAQGDGAILYSGWVGEVRSEVVAKELAHKTGLPIINDTARAQFLSSKPVETALHDSAQRILEAQGLSADYVEKSGEYFLYGDSKAAPESPLSVKNSLWGQASGEFTASVRGPVTVIASAADAERVLGRVELPTALQSTRITTLAGYPLSHLQDVHAQGGVTASLPKVQAQFIDASTKGIFVLPDNFGLPPSQVAISRELATTLDLDGSKFVGAQSLAEGGFVRASVSPVTPTAMLSPVAEMAPRGGFPPNMARGLGVVAAATVVYEGATTTAHSVELLRKGNITGAKAQIEHFASRTVGGFGLGAVGAELGSFGGPVGTLAGGAAGYGLGAYGGDKLMNAYDNHKIYNQADAQGRTWSYDPKQQQQGWTREVPTGEVGYAPNQPVVGYSVMPAPLMRKITADPALAERLTYQANNTAVELALGRTGTPVDPYTQPAAAQDTSSRIPAPWTRDVQTQQWSRMVTDRVLEHGLTSTHIEAATPQRARQLDTAAQQTIAANLASSPRGIAEHYQAAYQQRDWARQGPMPEAVISALKAPADTLQASDGHTYTQGTDGQWNTPGTLYGTNVAEGNVRSELDATRRAERAMTTAQADRHEAPALLPFSDPGHPQHAVLNKLQEVFPAGTSSERLHQATAACYTAGVREPQQLTGIVGNDHAIYFRSNILGSALGQMDMTKPAPEVQQTMQQVQHHDQQQAQMISQIQAQNAQIHAQGQQGPMLGGR